MTRCTAPWDRGPTQICTEPGCKRAPYGRLLLCPSDAYALIRRAFGTPAAPLIADLFEPESWAPEANEKGQLPDRPGGAAIEAA